MATRKTAVSMPTMQAQDDYQARDDMHTLKRAKEIESDGKRHAAAKKHAAREAAHYAQVAGAKVPAKRGVRS
jgi:hypothetical protein